MKLFHRKTQKIVKATIGKLSIDELTNLKNNQDFIFDWSLEKENIVYKICLLDTQEPLGLISVSDYQMELRIHINLIESSINNQGKNKEYQNIVGCLIAFVCRDAFIKGYDGFVSLISKSKLEKYYIDNYGFEKMGTHLVLHTHKSNLLIEKYL